MKTPGFRLAIIGVAETDKMTVWERLDASQPWQRLCAVNGEACGRLLGQLLVLPAGVEPDAVAPAVAAPMPAAAPAPAKKHRR